MAACLVYCVSHILFRMSLAVDVHCVPCSVQFSYIGASILACLNSAWMMFISQYLNCLLWPKTSCFLQSLARVRALTFKLATVICTWSLYWFTLIHWRMTHWNAYNTFFEKFSKLCLLTLECQKPYLIIMKCDGQRWWLLASVCSCHLNSGLLHIMLAINSDVDD